MRPLVMILYNYGTNIASYMQLLANYVATYHIYLVKHHGVGLV